MKDLIEQNTIKMNEQLQLTKNELKDELEQSIHNMKEQLEAQENITESKYLI